MPKKSRSSFTLPRMARAAGSVLIALAASGAISTSAQAAGKTLVFCSEGSPAGFDSAQYTTSTDFDAGAHAVYDTLVEFKRGSLDLVPGLAEKWEESPDAKTFTFHLRHGSSSRPPTGSNPHATSTPTTSFLRSSA